MGNHEDSYTLEERRRLLGIARGAIEGRLAGKRYELPLALPESFLQVRSCFVTLRSSDGGLRGCIGNIEPFQPLAANVAANAVNAAFSDPRFPPVSSREVDTLTIEVSILTLPREVGSYRDFIVGKHGIILNLSGSGAVFLPQVAGEQGWDAETTLSHLAMKAGLAHDAWRDPACRFKVFEAVYFSEADFSG
ncbi:MAG: AmmeMemoRadiSam system protein A [Victivallales bacterium]|nr:AmmeMemoRadiSam system protein A [Victivallales bacterium]